MNGARRKKNPQEEIFGPVRQIRPKDFEPKAFHEVVIALRRAGFRVCKASTTHHLVNGRMMTTKQVVAMWRHL